MEKLSEESVRELFPIDMDRGGNSPRVDYGSGSEKNSVDFLTVVSEQRLADEREAQEVLKEIREKKQVLPHESIQLSELKERIVSGSIGHKEIFDFRKEVEEKRSEKARARLEQLRDMLQSEDIDDLTRDRLMEADTIGVITGLKPVSLLQFRENPPKSLESTERVVSVLERLGIKTHIDYQGFMSGKGSTFMTAMRSYRPDEVRKSLKEPFFTREEIDLSEVDMEGFLSEYLTLKGSGLASHRIGILLGYPVHDVLDYVRISFLQEKYGADSVEGILENKQISPEDREFLKSREEKSAIMMGNGFPTSMVRGRHIDEVYMTRNPNIFGNVKGGGSSVSFRGYKVNMPSENERAKAFVEVFRLQREMFPRKRNIVQKIFGNFF